MEEDISYIIVPSELTKSMLEAMYDKAYAEGHLKGYLLREDLEKGE